MVERTAAALVSRVLDDYGKMAFVSGPRQFGKTTPARRFLAGRPKGLYCNWVPWKVEEAMERHPAEIPPGSRGRVRWSS